MRHVTTIITLVMFSFFILACKESEVPSAQKDTNNTASTQAVVTRVTGHATLTREGATHTLTAQEKLVEGDVLTTGSNGCVIVKLAGTLGTLEIQNDAVFNVSNYAKNERVIDMKKGNVWTRIDKVPKGGVVKVRTPSSLAAVKGTKFYTFTFGEYSGTCFCQGEVAYTQSTSGHAGTHDTDYLVVTRGDTTLTFTPKMFEEAGIEVAHNHSLLPDSDLGEQLTPDQMGALIGFLEDAFAKHEGKKK